MIEEMKFGDKVTIWKTKYNFKDRGTVVKDCYSEIEKYPDTKNEAYPYYEKSIKSSSRFNEKTVRELDEIRNFSVNFCVDLYGKKDYNTILMDIWINIVRIKPRQVDFRNTNQVVFHEHIDLSSKAGKFIPYYTFVTYIQMPNNLENKDGVLFIKDSNGKIYDFLPQEGDCIIMNGGLLHSPSSAIKSTLDRIVLAGNVSFETIKQNKTLL